MPNDDPEYPNTHADVLNDAGTPQEQERYRIRAASRPQELPSHHREAFAHHMTVATPTSAPNAPARLNRIPYPKNDHPPEADPG